MVLTSSLAALLHAVLVDVHGEQHVGVAALLLLHVGSACAACGDGGIQEEGGFLSRRGAKLTLILELGGGGRRQRTGSGRAKETTSGSRKRTDMKRVLEKRGKRKRGETINWPPAHISCPLH